MPQEKFTGARGYSVHLSRTTLVLNQRDNYPSVSRQLDAATSIVESDGVSDSEDY